MSDADEWQVDLPDEAATLALGQAMAAAAEPGTVIALVGSLGAGKTRLARAIAQGLGVDPRAIASPTFVLVHEYAGRLPVVHCDVYRLRDPAEFAALGAEEFLQSGAICLVEWADRVAGELPEDRLDVSLTITGETSRRVRMRAGGPRARRVLAGVAGAGG